MGWKAFTRKVPEQKCDITWFTFLKDPTSIRVDNRLMQMENSSVIVQARNDTLWARGLKMGVNKKWPDLGSIWRYSQQNLLVVSLSFERNRVENAFKFFCPPLKKNLKAYLVVTTTHTENRLGKPEPKRFCRKSSSPGTYKPYTSEAP